MANEVPNGQRMKPHFSRDPNRSDVPDSPQHEQVLRLTLRNGIEHLHGPEEVEYGKEELVVLCLLYNGRHYLESFLEHYFALGAKHVVFLDNGSTDGTVEALQNHENVTLLRSTLPYGKYLISMKRYLIERFGRDRWTLMVDQDELFDYPYSDVVSVGELLGYLNDNSYTAVASYMLDMFPEAPLDREAMYPEDEPLKELHRFYDISDVRIQSYSLADDTGNVRSNEDVEVLRDGIRHTLFGSPSILLKHPLVFLDGRLKPMDLSDHWVGEARIADFAGVLMHYKFLNRLYEELSKLVGERSASDVGLNNYSTYLGVLEQSPKLRIKQESSRELESVNDLIGTPFMPVSEEYLRFGAEQGVRKLGPEFLQIHSERVLRALYEVRRRAREQRRKAVGLQNSLNNAQRNKSDLSASFQNLQREANAIRTSRSWRLLSVLKVTKDRALGLYGRIKRGGSGTSG